jgi:hypothetical protein
VELFSADPTVAGAERNQSRSNASFLAYAARPDEGIIILEDGPIVTLLYHQFHDSQ